MRDDRSLGKAQAQTPEQLEESRLIERAKQGDKQAISDLYHRHVEVLYRYIYARVRNVTVAEDLTAQVFLKALEGLPGYRPRGKPFVAWLYRIAYARTVDYWREQEHCREVSLIDTLPADGPQPHDNVEAEADWIAAIDLLAQLSDDQQDVLILRFLGGLSLAQVAETLGKTLGAVKAIQHRGLASLVRLQKQGTSADLNVRL
jgi:RNA polymerase sigma-70 factor (ECF subfamily)